MMSCIAQLYTNALMINSSGIALCDPKKTKSNESKQSACIQKLSNYGDCLAASNCPVFISKHGNHGIGHLSRSDGHNSFEQTVLSRMTGLLQEEFLSNPVWFSSWRNGFNIFTLVQPSITLFRLDSRGCWTHLSGPLIKLNRRQPARMHSPSYSGTAPTRAYGPHMFLYATKPSLHPDLLLNRLSFSNWIKGTFSELEGYSRDQLMNCEALINVYKTFRLFRLQDQMKGFENYCNEEKTIANNAIPHYKVKCLISAVYKRLKFRHLMGSDTNSNRLLHVMRQLYTSNRFTYLPAKYLMRGIKFSECQWLSASPVSTRENFLTAAIGWLIKTLNYLIKYLFYVSESKESKKRLLFYLHSYWRSQSNQTIGKYEKMNVLERCDNHHAPYSWNLRFIPTTTKLRPILKQVKSTFSKLGAQSGKIYLKDVKRLLRQVFQMGKEYLAQVTDLPSAFRCFALKRDPSKRYYYLKADIHKAYDSINRVKLLNVIKKLLNKQGSGFILYKLKVLFSENGVLKDKIVIHLQPYKQPIGDSLRRSGAPLQPAPRLCHLTAEVSETISQNCKLRNCIITNLDIQNTVYGEPKVLTNNQILAIISKHLETTFIKYDSDVFYLKSGIPQGSKLSSILCDIFYGSMEYELMQSIHLGDDELLLRNQDDYLLVSSNQDHLQLFIDTLKCDASQSKYNCHIQLPKTCTNCTNIKGVTVEEGLLKWCQYEFTSDWECLLPKYSIHDIKNGVSFDGTKRPFEHMKAVLLKQICVYANPAYLDCKVNSIAVVERNIHNIFAICARKLACLSHFLQPGCLVNLNPWIDLLRCLAARLLKVLKNYCRKNGDGISCHFRKIWRICCCANVEVLTTHRKFAEFVLRIQSLDH